MKLFIGLTCMLFVLSACNLQETIKQTGDAVQTGAGNVGEAVMQAPAAIGEAINNVDKNIRQ